MKPMPEDWDRAVAVVAHPDDLEYGVASAVARWTGQGKKVSYLLATRGEAGIAGMPPDQVAPLRMEEERLSAEVVGVTEVEFLDYQDGLVEYGIGLRRHLAGRERKRILFQPFLGSIREFKARASSTSLLLIQVSLPA